MSETTRSRSKLGEALQESHKEGYRERKKNGNWDH